MVAASGSVPPVSAFDNVMMSGSFAGEQAPGPAEAGEDFIEDEEQLVAIRQLSQPAQHLRVVEAHAACALHQWFDDDARKLLGVTLDEARNGFVLAVRYVEHRMLGEKAAE
jgi:hypothetical protein